MIVVREIFQLKFGKAKDALELIQPMVSHMKSTNPGEVRLLTDLVGNYYNLVMEVTYSSMEKYVAAMENMPAGDLKDAYTKFCDVVIGGHREIWTVVE